MRKLSCTLLIVLLAAAAALADRTRTWQQSRFDDFQKGTSRGVAILSGGRLEMAPAFRAIYTSPSTYIWTVVADPLGNVYAAAGSPARLYRYGADGSANVVFDPPELQIQALAMDRATGVIYAATSPDGKVYRLEPRSKPPAAPAPRRGRAARRPPVQPEPEEQELKVEPDETAFTSSVFFDPKTKYIWDLALDGQGNLYVATGDRGEVFRVTRGGESSVFFKSDEAHIRVLAFAPDGNLVAGSDGSGLVYRISPAGEAFVLYSAAKKEITALAIDQQGNIYAAGVGEKRSAVRAPSMMTAPQLQQAITVTVQAPEGGPQQAAPVQQAQPQQQPIQPAPPLGLGATGGSEVYRIAANGAPRRIWDSREDIVYALTFDQQGRLLVGTGNKGKIFSLSDDGRFTDLLKASATQVTAFAPAPNGGLFAATSNLGKLFLMDAAPGGEGTFESDVFDARIFSRWGRAEVRGTGNFDFYARSGNVDNPDRNWSPWKKVDLESGASVDVPPARFIQWRAVLRPGGNPHHTAVESVTLFYRPDNVAPIVDDVTVHVGARFQGGGQQRPQQGETMVIAAGGITASAQPQQQRADGPMAALRDRDSIAVRWSASDENDDELLYSLYYRGDGESRWKLLKDNISERFHTLEAGLLPDGGYTLKVVASDAPSNPPGEALTAERESPRFEVDNTPPRIEELRAGFEGDGIRVSFRAVDTFSNIRRAEYSIDAGPWHLIEPVKKLSDSLVESYDFVVVPPAERRRLPVAGRQQPAATDSEHVIVLRVYDRFDNMGTAKAVLRSD